MAYFVKTEKIPFTIEVGGIKILVLKKTETKVTVGIEAPKELKIKITKDLSNEHKKED